MLWLPTRPVGVLLLLLLLYSQMEHSAGNDSNDPAPNLLFIISDQLRFDTVRYMQERLSDYQSKIKINTPNIDRLASQGVVFETAYCISPSCAPARNTIRSGKCLQRGGIKGNQMVKESVYKRMGFLRDAVSKLNTYEQLLVDQKGYTAENYGKFHVPVRQYFSKIEPSRRVIEYNNYDFETQTPQFKVAQTFKRFYQPSAKFLLESDNINLPFKYGQQKNYYSQYPYTPITLDVRYGRATNTPLSSAAGFPRNRLGNSNVCGRDSLPEEYTTTAVLGKIALASLDRMSASGKPFSLSVNFNAPHPPMVATSKYLDRYWDVRDKLFVSPSINDPMTDSAYIDENTRKRIGEANYGYDDPDKIAELTAVYYALVEEVDTWVGRLVDRLEKLGVADNTLVIFTSDHGETLGAHGMVGKGVLLEEATRVPLVMRFPGRIPPNVTVTESVSHIDVFSTIMDYFDFPELAKGSDGETLRRFIDKSRPAYNRVHDETAIVVEIDKRYPRTSTKFGGKPLGGLPNFAIRHGKYKLIMTKKHDSLLPDMLYDLDKDPYEMNNILPSLGGKSAAVVGNEVIGKAEHLKALLWEWLKRHDGPERYYSNPAYNMGDGMGDVKEIFARRTWRNVPYWQSHSDELVFGRPAVFSRINEKTLKKTSYYIRNEFVYVGKTAMGPRLRIENVRVVGNDAKYFKVWCKKREVPRNWWSRIKVRYQAFERDHNPSGRSSSQEGDQLNAFLEISTSFPRRVNRIQLKLKA